MLFKCIAIDDEPPALELIKNHAARLPQLTLLQTFDDAISGGEFLRSNPVDILFVDVNMPDITGIELVRSLKIKPLIIFTTAYKKFAYDGFELEAIDYLLKPINFERFGKAVKKAIEFHQYKALGKNKHTENIFVRSEYKMIKIELNDIDYVEGLEDYIKIHLTSGRPVLTLTTLKAFLEKLPAEKFLRIHRSYIIPLANVSSVVNKKVLLNTGQELPISDSYTSAVNDWMNAR
ncbi:MAG: LytTR family DNA-binding domain-containing protein [Ferruginibacter sp.]